MFQTTNKIHWSKNNCIHGYDFFAPDYDVVYHLYSPNKHRIRPVFWDEGWDWKYKVARESEFRINYILGLHNTVINVFCMFHPHISLNRIDLREIDKYGLGKNRNISSYWEFSRISIKKLSSGNLCKLYENNSLIHHRIPWSDPTHDPWN